MPKITEPMFPVKNYRSARRQLERKRRTRELTTALALGLVCAAIVAGGILLANLATR